MHFTVFDCFPNNKLYRPKQRDLLGWPVSKRTELTQPQHNAFAANQHKKTEKGETSQKYNLRLSVTNVTVFEWIESMDFLISRRVVVLLVVVRQETLTRKRSIDHPYIVKTLCGPGTKENAKTSLVHKVTRTAKPTYISGQRLE